MTRRWFLKLVSMLAPLFGVKPSVEAEQPVEPQFDAEGLERWRQQAKRVEPQRSELEARCRMPGTLTAALLEADNVRRYEGRITRDGVDLYTPNADGVTCQLHRLPLPARLNNPAVIERAMLGFDEEVLGVFNFPHRWVMLFHDNESVLERVLSMRQDMLEHKFYGPFAFLHPANWEWHRQRFHDVERVKQVTTVQCCIGVEQLNGTDKIALVQLTPDVIQLVVCPDRIVPRIRCDFYGNCGICVGEMA